MNLKLMGNTMLRICTVFAVGAVICLCAGALMPAAAQQAATVRGRVLDESGAAIGSAQVVAESAAGARVSTQADAEGRYAFVGLRPGSYRLLVEAVGYGTGPGVAVELGAGEVELVDLEVRADPVALAPVEVAVSRGRFEATYAATRAETKVSEDLPADFNPANNYDVLRLVPGVSYLFGAGGRFGKPSRIRGASTWAIADVIEDFPSVREAGIGAEDGGFTADFGSTIPAIALAGIEVKKGSLGVLYGADADGGVIVNELKRGSGPPSGALWLEASPLGEELYMADVGLGGGGFDLYAAGKLLDGDYDDIVDPAGRALSTDDLRSGLVRAGWTPSEDARLELIALRGRDRIRYTQPTRDDPATAVDESATLPHDRFRTTNESGFYGATFDHVVSRALGYELGYSLFQQHALRYSVTEERAHRDRPEETNTAFGNAYWNRDLAPGLEANLKGGFEWTRHVQEEDANDSEKEQTFTDRSVFLASTLGVGRGLTLSGGLRYVDATDDFGDHTIWLHDLGGAYDVDGTGTRLVTSWSTGYSRNKGFAYFFGPIREAGGVEVTRNETVEASVEQRLPTPWASAGLLTATVFKMWNDGVPVFSGWGAETVYYEEQEVDGLELYVEYPLASVAALTGSFTLLDTEIVATTHPDGVNVGSSGVRVPRYAGALAVSVTPTPVLDLSLIGTYDDGMRREILDSETDEVTVTTSESYTRLNVASDWRVAESVSLRLRVENLLDETDLGYSTQTLGPDGVWTFDESVARDPGRILSAAVVLHY
ncbi:MAG: TonB-dependent receptor [Longimicrobiales bacterium]